MARSTSHALAAGLSILSILAHPASSYGQSFEYRYSRVPLAITAPGEPTDPTDPENPEEPAPSSGCVTPWGDELASGEAVQAFLQAAATTQEECLPETRTCTNGLLSGSGAHPICVVDNPEERPDPISFATSTGAEPYEWRRSSIQRISGISEQVPVAVSGRNSRFRLCHDADCLTEVRGFSAKAGHAAPGTYVQVERRAATLLGADEVSTLVVGQISATFTVSTRPGDSCDVAGYPLEHGAAWDFFQHTLHAACSSVMQTRTCVDGAANGDASYDKPFCDLVDQDRMPDVFSFQPVTGLAVGTEVESEAITLSGFDWRLPIIIARTESTLGQHSICKSGRDCGDAASWTNWSTSRLNVEAGDRLRLKLRASGKVQTTATLSVTLGDFVSTWSVSTRLGEACTTPWGDQVPHGVGVPAYEVPLVDFGVACPVETRTCDDGTLGGSFLNQTCLIDEQDDQPDTLAMPDLTGAEANANLYSDYVQATGFTGSLPLSLSGGTGGVFQVCDGPNSSCGSLNADPKEIRVGQYFRARQRAGDYGTTASVVMQLGPLSQTWSISTRPALTCEAPWGGVIEHGQTVSSFRYESVTYGNQCPVEPRTCNDGSLSGSTLYPFPNCVVEEQVVDIDPFPLGSSETELPGAWVYSNQVQLTGFTGSATLDFARTGPTDTSLTIRFCSSDRCPVSGWGTFSSVSNPREVPVGRWFELRAKVPDWGETVELAVSALGTTEIFRVRPRDPASCETPWGSPMEHGETIRPFMDSLVPYNSVCRAAGRTCSDGRLGGSTNYVHEACTVDIPRPNPFTYTDTFAPAGSSSYARSDANRMTGTSGNIPVTVTGFGQINRSTNTACSGGSWSNVNGTLETVIPSNNYFCLRAYPGSTPGEINSMTIESGDQSATWNLIAQ